MPEISDADLHRLNARADAAEALVERQRSGIKGMQKTLREIETEMRRLQQGVPHDEWHMLIYAVRITLLAATLGWRGWIAKKLIGRRIDHALGEVDAARDAIVAHRDANTSAKARHAADAQVAALEGRLAPPDQPWLNRAPRGASHA